VSLEDFILARFFYRCSTMFYFTEKAFVKKYRSTAILYDTYRCMAINLWNRVVFVSIYRRTTTLGLSLPPYDIIDKKGQANF
jgi:hypothetical protein